NKERVMNQFFVMYTFRVEAEKQEQFMEAWGALTSEVRLRYSSFGCNLHSTETGFVAYAQWPDEKSWRSFWEEREQKVEALPRLRECLREESDMIPLPLMSSSLTVEPTTYQVF
ncbi:MAG: hypothetical protein AAF202_07005, partial [Pseudomonadota bacterium]